ncbi:MAG TPA: ABC transporter ATP-binding protein [Thermodesulfobacteriota bacterium]|nr:ABC transporter ATP-binding protein [Thermodesulfobacteriota bacterium]
MDRTIHLSIDQLHLSIGGLKILNDISINICKGDLFALIGPNGAGKTSLLNCLSGIYNPTQGRLLFGGHDLAKLKSHEVARIGIARTFQLTELFRNMNVLDNLLLGRHIKMQRGLFSNGFFWRETIKEEVEHREVVERIIGFLELGRYRKHESSSLPYGTQKIVGLGRALAMEPQILLLDEPSAGMNHQEKEDLARFILRIKYEMGITLIWVEHDMQLVGDLADEIGVLNFGTKIAQGKPKEVLNDPEVIRTYLGARAHMQ